MVPVEIVLTRDSFRRPHIFFSVAKLMNASRNRTYSVAYSHQNLSLIYTAKTTKLFLFSFAAPFRILR
jgi:hypothetical protein